MVVLFNATSVKNVEGLFFTPCLLKGLPLEVKLQIKGLVKLPCFSVFHVQLGKEGALQHVVKLVSFLKLQLPLDYFVDVWPQASIESQQDGFLPAPNGGMGPSQKGILKNHLIFLTEDVPLPYFVFNAPQIYDSDELRRVFLVVNYLSYLVVPCLQLPQNKIHYLVREIPKEVYFVEKQFDEIFLIGLPMLLLTDVRDGHDLVLVVFVHEIGKAFLFRDPFGVLIVLGLSEVDGFGIGVLADLFPHVLIFVAERVQLPPVGQVVPLDFIVDYRQQVKSFVHVIYLPYIPYIYYLQCQSDFSCSSLKILTLGRANMKADIDQWKES